jgi:glycosyltransferase involved in cell wall biosynthesis
MAALNAIDGRFEEAQEGWRTALEIDKDCLPARLNRDLVEAEVRRSAQPAEATELQLVPAPGQPQPRPLVSSHLGPIVKPAPAGTQGNGGAIQPSGPIRVALLSFLFNWPSTGGGNMHTAGLARFLARAGYEVRHFYARYRAWGIGNVTEEGLVGAEAIEFGDSEWNVPAIQARYRRAVDQFQPDYVAITDVWNMKPHLAAATRGYPCLLLFQAQECLCPLNNLRLLGIGPSGVEQCPRNQLATPEICHGCLAERGHHAGGLHQRERALAAVGTADYDRVLRQSLQEAEAVLVLNPITAAMLEPYAKRVCIAPWGIDPSRFPWPPPDRLPEALERPAVLFMAAVAGEAIKGFHVAHEACRILRQTRSDFELVVTFNPAGPIDDFTRSVGWCSQADLPRHYQAADICLVPTIAQDALSITSVEAMAAGIPVIASRIGGLPYTVTDGVNGLLCEPGDAADLARKIATLLDDGDLRRRMGLAGRKRFEDEFTWEGVIERYWRPLLQRPVRR